MIKLIITIYAIYLYNNLYPDKMNLINLILLCLFPGFFIAATATINIHYLNPLYNREVGEYDYANFMNDLIQLNNLDTRFFTIFLPVYLIINYLLYFKLFNTFLKEKTELSIKEFLKKKLESKKKAINNNKITYLILGILLRFRGALMKNIFKTSLSSGSSLSRSL